MLIFQTQLFFQVNCFFERFKNVWRFLSSSGANRAMDHGVLNV